jgi:hypothetical protein
MAYPPRTGGTQAQNRPGARAGKEHPMSDTPLEQVPGWSADHVRRVNASWITTAEQVVSLSATDRGLQSLAEQLSVDKDEAWRLVESARAQLAPAVRAKMEEKVDPRDYGLGALPPG